MGSSRISAILSAAVSSITTSNSPDGRPSGLSHPVGSDHRFGWVGLGQKSNLRFSTSLQDFSTFCKLDPEEGNPDHGIDNLSHAKPPRPLQRENAGTSFSKERALPPTSLLRKKWVRAAVGLLCLLLFFYLIYVCSKKFSTKASQFYVVLDCGSTGTRVYVYEWSIDNKCGSKSLPIMLNSLPEGVQRRSSSRTGRAYHRMETEPGFHKLVHNVSGLRAAIKPLLKWAEKQIPKHAHKSTSLFLYATAGVRRLPSSDSEWLLENAWSILKNSSFLCQRHWVKTITGMEEAYYGWIALNYHMGMLGSSPAKGTFGALDLGGSSLQVTFETKEILHDETSLNLSIGAVSHHLSAYSLSGYGLNDAFDKSVVHLLKSQFGAPEVDLNSGRIELKHPCLQTGYKEKYICSQCASLNRDGSPLVGETSTGKGRSGIAIELLGAPQWEECSALAKITVNLSEWSHLSPGIDCELQPCALSNNLPQPHGKFYAMSGFFVVFKFFNLTSEATLDDVLQKGQEFCEKNWEVAKNSVIQQPFIEQYCFRAPYIVSLLREGLYITDDQVVIGSGSITWTLGVALLEAGQALSNRLELQSYIILYKKINPTVLVALLFLSLILLICAISCIGNWMPRFFHGPYLPLFRHKSATTNSVLNIPSPFRFQRWSPINSGDGRVKTPLSPTVACSGERPFGMGHGFGGSSIQLMEASLHPSGGFASHSYSSGSLGQMQFDNGAGSFWTPNRSQMRLQSRRSQSREDLSSSLADAHMV
ncbi:putative apyrase 7 isoform X2 [Tasmannia lanceolata]